MNILYLITELLKGSVRDPGVSQDKFKLSFLENLI